MKRKRNLIMLSILFLSIGFAAVTTTLIINGTLRIGANSNDFDRNVIFTRADADVESRASISADGKIINFSSRELKNIYEEATLDFDVTNKSRQYGVEAVIECTKVDETNPYNDYISLDITPYAFELGIGETQSGKLTATMIKSFIGDENTENAEIEINCTIRANATEVDTDGDDSYIPAQPTKNTISGYLVDENNQVLANKNMVIYSNNETYFVTTDENGYYSIDNITDGDYEIFIIEGKTMDEIKKMTIEEIRNIAIIKGTYTTDDNTLTFDNGIKTAPSEPKTITFDATGLDSSIPPINVVEGEPYGTLPSPTKEGYTFEGWYLGDELILPSTIVNLKDGQTLTPKFTISNYTISYNLNGGTNSSSNPTGYNVSSNAITLVAPTRTGYTFTGWTGSNGSTAQTSVTIATGSTGNKSYTANWTLKSYTATISAGTGGSVGSSSVSVSYGGTKTFTVTPSAGYYLSALTCTNGYTTNATVGTTQTSSQTVTLSNNSKDATSACTATFTAITYTISYTMNSGTNSSSNPTSYKVTSNAITLVAPTRTGYTFTGWTGSNGTTAQTSVTIAKGSTGNRSYTANWTAKTYTLNWIYPASGTTNTSSIKYGENYIFNMGVDTSNMVLTCTNGYTVEIKDITTGYYIIHNNNIDSDTTCCWGRAGTC